MDNYEELHIEQDFWDDFIVEAFEHINDIEENVLDLEQRPDDMEIIHTMFRAFHTIKGLSGFVEHTIVQEIAHKTETMMDLCRKGELTVNTPIVDAILKSSDYIKRLCEDVESYKNGDFIEQIKAHLLVLEDLSEPKGEMVAQEPQQPAQEEQKQEFQAEVEPAVEIIQEIIDNTEEPSPERNLEAFANVTLELIDEEQTPSDEPEEGRAETFEEETLEAQETAKEEATEELNVENFEAEQFEQKEIEPETVEEEITEHETIERESFENEIFEPEAETTETTEIAEVAPAVEEPAAKVVEAIEKTEVVEPAKTVAKPAEAPAIKKAVSSNEDYMKVANSKIDHLVDMIGELIISQSLIDQYISSHYSQDNQLIGNMSGFLRITRELQSLSMSLRMVSFKSTFQKVARIARDTIQELNKDVEFVTSGDSTEIDRAVTDKLLDPLVHLIKNAISHGVEENPEDRINAGKSRKARVELNAYSKRGKIYIEIKDDGRGINTEIVYNKALEKGLIDPNRTYSEEEIKEFIMLPGFSTAAVVDNISGRGVGMDVVKTQIIKLGGKVDIQSKLGEGSIFTLEVPVNHAIMNGTIIEMRGQDFIIPTINVKEILQPRDDQWIFTQGKRTMLRVRDDIISIIPVSTFFKGEKLDEHVPLVVLLEVDGKLKALAITKVINRQEVVVKPVGAEFAELKYISGMSILGTGKVSLILDIDYLFKKEVK